MLKKLNLMAGILGVLALLMSSPSWAQEQAPPGPRQPRRPPKRPSFTIPRRWRP